MSESFIRAIGGTPMVDSHVNTRMLFALVCEKRRRINGSCHPPNYYASPVEAKGVYAQVYQGQAVEEYPSVDIDADRLHMISETIGEIAEVVPEWKSYFMIPIRWRLLTIPNVGSDTAPHIPQSIFFGEKVFKTRRALREQIVHEMSHVWMALTLEITPWTQHSEIDFVLPSGTGDKKIWQVVLALCFAASVVKLYRGLIAKGGGRPEDVSRMRWASSYAQGCIKTARESRLLAENGTEIVNACDRESNIVVA